MAAEWYYTTNKQQMGPVSWDELRQLATQGLLKPNDLVWTEGMGWNRGGSVAWQVFDKSGRPTRARGRADGVPVWSLVAVFAQPSGDFTILY